MKRDEKKWFGLVNSPGQFPILFSLLVVAILSGSLSSAGQSFGKPNPDKDIPVPKSITVDKSLSRQQADELIRTAKMLYAFWNTGNEYYLHQAVSDDFVDSTLPKGRPQGVQGIVSASTQFRKSVPDLRCQIEDLIIVKDKIICRQLYTGTNTGPTMEHPATGNPIRFVAIDILHVRNGKVYEDWHLEDNVVYLEQAGVIHL